MRASLLSETHVFPADLTNIFGSPGILQQSRGVFAIPSRPPKSVVWITVVTELAKRSFRGKFLSYLATSIRKLPTAIVRPDIDNYAHPGEEGCPKALDYLATTA